MREIKFRALVNGEWFYFDLTQNPKYWAHKLEDGIIDQYTGLVDKNGVEIYEDDVILITNKSYKNKARVEWSVLGVKWVLIYNDLSVYELATWHESVYEVIGNIYENHELLLEEN